MTPVSVLLMVVVFAMVVGVADSVTPLA